MQRIEKTVFISYRRTNFPWAMLIYQNLTANGYDVFIDYLGIASGSFETAILENITSRAHFLILLTPSALERCGEPRDMMRREIEKAIETERNVVPLMLEGFSFSTPAIANQLTGTLAPVKDYQGLSVPNEYFMAAMERLRGFLNVPLSAVIHPPSASAIRAAKQQNAAANAAPPVREEELTAQQYFEQAFASSDLDEEIRLNSEAIRLEPSFSEAYNNRGIAREQKGDLEGALQDYNKAIELKPDHAGPYNNRGNARQERGDLDGALEDYGNAIQIKPDYAEAYYNRGNALEAKGDLEGALEDYGNAIQIKPDYAAAYFNRGIARKEKGDLDGTLDDYSKAIQFKPDHANAHYNRAELFIEKDQPAAAIVDFQRYLTLGRGARDGDTAKVEKFIRDLKEKL
jgi:tetratricopeptide (TPR) repeat protein